MPGRHSPSPETTSDNLFTAPEDAYRGKHSRTRRGALGRTVLVAAAALAVVGGTGGYVAFTVGADADQDSTVAAADLQTRSAPERASRSGGPCGRNGPGQKAVEAYLATQVARFGQVTADGQQDDIDCVAITRFQSWAQIPNQNGYADAVTTDVARRLAATRPAACQAPSTRTTVCVDLTHQTLWVMKNGRPAIGPTVVRSGRKGLETPTGWYTVDEKKVDTVSTEYRTRLPHWQSFYRDFGFHATEVPMYSTGVPGSHGCINLLPGDARALYGLTAVGTAVHVFGRKPA